jgi:alpha-galactosidase/6-phospho-beta-glucosidase family protein
MEQKTVTLTYTDADDLMRKAESVLYRAYYESVSRDGESIKEDLIDAIKSGEVDDEDAASEWLQERLHETADSDEWIIYTHKAKLLLLVSENEDAAEDEGMECETVEQRAYWAFRADLQEWMDRNADISELLEEFGPKDEEDEADGEDENEAEGTA